MHDLGSNMDDFLDIVEDCAKNLLMYRPKKVDKQIVEIVEYLAENGKILVEITKDLQDIIKNNTKIIEGCDKIKHTEHVVDDIYSDYISHLFENEPDFIELVKNKNIMETFEAASDSAKTVSDTIRTIMIKKS